MQVKNFNRSLPFLILSGFLLLFRERAVDQTVAKIVYGDLSAPNQIVLFEEFACPACNDFFHESGSWLLDTYVKTGKATLSIVPLALFERSLPAATATMALIALKKELVYPFMDFVFSLPEQDFSLFNAEQLLKTFEFQGFSLNPEIYTYIENFSEIDIEKNCRWIERIERDILEVPSLFVNGIRVYPLNNQNIIKSLEGF